MDADVLREYGFLVDINRHCLIDPDATIKSIKIRLQYHPALPRRDRH